MSFYHTGIKYAELVYTVYLRRRPLFYVVNIILPSIMLHMLATSTFLVPPDAGERISLGLTCFLAYPVFTLIVADKVPDSSVSTPLVSKCGKMDSFAIISNFRITMISQVKYKRQSFKTT